MASCRLSRPTDRRRSPARPFECRTELNGRAVASRHIGDGQRRHGSRRNMGAGAGGERRCTQHREPHCRQSFHRVARKFPSRRFVAFNTASAAPRGGSTSVKHDPTSRVASSARADSETITTVASNARTAFTPSNSNVSRGWTACSNAFTAATAQQRSSPVGDETPSDDPSKRRPSDHVSTTLPGSGRWPAAETRTPEIAGARRARTTLTRTELRSAA